MTKRSTQSRERGQGGDFVPFHLPLAGSRGGAPLWGLGQRHNCCSSSLLKKRSQQSAGNEASLPVTLRIRRCAPQLALSITSTLSRPLARPSGSSFLIMLAHCDTQGFRLCGGDEGAFRSPPRPLRCALPCFLVFIVESGTRLRALLRDRPR